MGQRQDDWRGNAFKIKKVKNAIRAAIQMAREGGHVPWDIAKLGSEPAPAYEMEPLEQLVDKILSLVKQQHEY